MSELLDDLSKEFKLSQKYINLIKLCDNQKSEIYVVRNTDNDKIYVKKDLTNYNIEVFNIIKNIDSNYMPRVYEVIEHNGILTIIEEYINGRTLSELLEEEKSLNDEKIIKYAVNLCDALNELHKLKPPIIHRDIKLSNIIVTNDDFVKLIDFDVSRTYKSEEKRDTTMFGTHEYAAPEQFGFAQTDGRTDIYAIGVVMNLLSTRQFPVMKKSEGALKEIIEKCIKMSPSERYQSVEELKKDLNEVKSKLNKASKIDIHGNNDNSENKNLIYNLSEKLKKEEKLLKEKKAKREEKKQKEVENQKVIEFNTIDNLNEEVKKVKEKNILEKIPGFRSMQGWKIVVAVILVYIPLGAAILIGELALKEVAIAFLLIWFLLTNFLNIKEKLPLINSTKTIIINAIGYILYIFIILFIGFIVLGVTLTTFGV